MTVTTSSRELRLDDTERADATRRTAEARYEEIYAPQRTWAFLSLMAAFCSALWGLSLVAGVRALFRVTPERMGLTMLAQFSFIAAATIAARFFGGPKGRAHHVAEGLESLACAACAASLIYASGSAVSIFWMLTALHLMNNAQEILGARTTRLAHAASLGAVAIAFALERKSGDALIVVFFGALLFFLARTQEIATRRLLDAQVERDVLRRRLEDAIAQRERTRVARDLHDGVGARLAALTWRADAIAASDSSPERLRELSDQARTGLSELRQVVRGMKSDEASLDELATSLEADCRSLAPPGCALHFRRRGHGIVRRDVRLQLGFVVREAIRNAAQHAAPSEIRVSFTLDDTFELRVENDGHPPPEDMIDSSRGGLSHLAERAAEHGATLRVDRDAERTSLVWRMPRGSCLSAVSE